MKIFFITITLLAVVCAATPEAQSVRRLKGRIVSEAGAAIANADVHAEAFFGYAAGTYAGQRTFSTKTDAKGDWNILGFQPGVWLFDASAPGYLPETIALPIQILTTESSMQSGVAFTWQLVLKAVPSPDGDRGRALADAEAAARSGDKNRIRTMLGAVPEDADAVYLAGAGRVCLVARDMDLARTLFTKALEKDPASYRAALGIASTFLLQRDFDSASRAFDAARNRTKDKDEQKFLTVAIGDLATIKVR